MTIEQRAREFIEKTECLVCGLGVSLNRKRHFAGGALCAGKPVTIRYIHESVLQEAEEILKSAKSVIAGHGCRMNHEGCVRCYLRWEIYEYEKKHGELDMTGYHGFAKAQELLKKGEGEG